MYPFYNAYSDRTLGDIVPRTIVRISWYGGSDTMRKGAATWLSHIKNGEFEECTAPHCKVFYRFLEYVAFNVESDGNLYLFGTTLPRNESEGFKSENLAWMLSTFYQLYGGGPYLVEVEEPHSFKTEVYYLYKEGDWVVIKESEIPFVIK